LRQLIKPCHAATPADAVAAPAAGAVPVRRMPVEVLVNGPLELDMS
jgi:hypothetical protein